LKKRIDNFIEALKKRYKVIVLENDTFVEKISIKAPFWYLLSWLLAGFILLFFIVAILIKISPFREYLIGDEGLGDRQELVQAYSQIDSLSQIVDANNIYLDNIKGVLEGAVGETEKEALERESRQDEKQQSVVKKSNTSLTADERILQDLLSSGAGVQNKEKFSSERGISSYAFYSPVRGIVSGQYDARAFHFATDIATKLNEPIKATLDGHVIFASFTPSTGYVIIVQHIDNLISVYKHCAVLLKKAGSFVRGGEVIAMVGNTGELSTGPHLHFELWNGGNPVNPENYITF